LLQCKTEESKVAYEKQYYEHPKNCGGSLIRERTVPNPGLAGIEKIKCNSNWGRFVLREDLSVSSFYHHAIPKDRTEFFNKLWDCENFHVNAAPIPLHRDGAEHPIYELRWTACANDSNPKNKDTHTNVPIGIFTTAYARLELFNAMNKLPDRVVYYDTDSIIYKVDEAKANYPVPPGCLKWNEMLPEGPFLGQWKREPEDGAEIDSMVCGGAKSYTKTWFNSRTHRRMYEEKAEGWDKV
jgi:hypothetical protein